MPALSSGAEASSFVEATLESEANGAESEAVDAEFEVVDAESETVDTEPESESKVKSEPEVVDVDSDPLPPVLLSGTMRPSISEPPGTMRESSMS